MAKTPLMRRLFLHLLKRYTRTEQDRLVVLKEVFNGVLQDYTEQTMPGNIHNFTIETLLANDWVRHVVEDEDQGTLQIVKNIITYAVDEAYSHIRTGEGLPPMELKVGWHRIEKGRKRTLK